MTIKEFAHICGCNPQTLRYYDQIDLLKPVKVDRWSGYRFYDEEQAYVFVKIKNLQKAGFTIDEIRGLLDKDNLAICRAFDEKIAKEEKRLQEIKDIRQSYQTEMNNIKNKIDAVRKKITEEMQAYNQTSEFGLDADKYEELIDNVNRYLDNVAFVSTLMGLILTKNPDKNCGFTCNIEKSKDNKNHFRVFKTKG
jgi:hypothetical protein